jgi:hypothetical protein
LAQRAVFTARAIARHDEALKAFITDDLLQRRKLIHKVQQYQHPHFEELRQAALASDLLKRVDAEITDTGAKPLKTERLAQLAGMHDWYTTAYAMLSMATHSQVRDLECYLLLDEDEKIRSLEYAPSLKEVPWLLLTVAHAILLGGDSITATFRIPFPAKEGHMEFINAQFAKLPPETSRPGRG